MYVLYLCHLVRFPECFEFQFGSYYGRSLTLHFVFVNCDGWGATDLPPPVDRYRHQALPSNDSFVVVGKGEDLRAELRVTQNPVRVSTIILIEWKCTMGVLVLGSLGRYKIKRNEVEWRKIAGLSVSSSAMGDMILVSHPRQVDKTKLSDSEE